jgi:hypothetical protein
LQGLIISYRPPNGATTNPPFNTMDTFSFNQFAGGCDAVPGPPNANNNTTPSNVGASVNGYCDPLYPVQFADKHFVDTPKGGYALDSFRGVALLSTITTKTNGAGAVTERDVTVYGGVSYGFDVFVTPEPSTYALFLGGMLLAPIVKRRAKRAK